MIYFFLEFVKSTVHDNEIASESERKLWQMKWKLPSAIRKALNIKESPTPPAWSDTYISEGVLHLPYAEIDEPFYAWVDFKNGSSRIDFYGGKLVATLNHLFVHSNNVCSSKKV